MPLEPDVDLEQLALGVQQPWAELILTGIKTLEIRRSNTRCRGTIYIYSSQKFSSYPAARRALKRHQLDRNDLIRGCILGTVEIVDSRQATREDSHAASLPAKLLTNRYSWVLSNPIQFKQPLEVRYQPYGVWFYPFKRKSG